MTRANVSPLESCFQMVTSSLDEARRTNLLQERALPLSRTLYRQTSAVNYCVALIEFQLNLAAEAL